MSHVVQEQAEGITLSIHAQPGAARSGFAGVKGVELFVRVAAAPHEGAANKELCAFLAKFFHVPKSAVEVVRGKTSRHKAVLIRGQTSELMAYIQVVLASEIV